MSAGSMFSPLWHRVDKLKPRLRPGTEVVRQVARGEVWYVARNRLSNRVHRFSAGVYAVLMRMNGTRTLDEIWQQTQEEFGEDAPSQDQVIQLVSQLYGFDMLQTDRAVDVEELSDRAERYRRGAMLQRYRNPLFFRLPLIDPNRFLDATVHLVRPLFGPLGLLLWLAAVGWFAAEAVLHWHELTADISDRVLATNNLVLLVVVFPLLKAIHELGHAYATKVHGGEVHEVGVMFLVLMPAPYVDATASALFPGKRARIVVGAAGMAAELAVAALAMAVWLAAEPGLVRAIAFNTMLVASVSTLAFNANPLLRFDGYYILADLIEIPNLATRAARYYGYLAQRYLFGTGSALTPVSAPGERFWFLVYAPAALAYRFVVLFGIALLLATRFQALGAALIAWTLAINFLWPLAKGIRFVAVSPALTGHRLRAFTVTIAAVGVVAAALLAVPLPDGTVVRGIVWVPDEAQLFTETAGEVTEIIAKSGSLVAAGDPVLKLADPLGETRRQLLAAQVEELTRRLAAAEVVSRFDASQIREHLAVATGELAEADRRAAALTVRAMQAGVVIIPRAEDLPGLFLKQGQFVAYVMPEADAVIRALVPENDVDRVRSTPAEAMIRLDDAPWQEIGPAEVRRMVPSAGRRLPSAALASANGGPFATDPTAKEANTSLSSFFEVDIALPASQIADHWGTRAWVRFDHGTAPVGVRLYRRIRQVFLSRFSV